MIGQRLVTTSPDQEDNRITEVTLASAGQEKPGMLAPIVGRPATHRQRPTTTSPSAIT